MTTTWANALAWRLSRQLLHPVTGTSVEHVLGRLTAVPRSSGDPELALAVRREQHDPGDLAAAVAAGGIITSYTFRGAVHLMTIDDAAMYLAIRASNRQWELPSWQEHYELTADEWPEFRELVRSALAGGPLTSRELAAAVGKSGRFIRAADALTAGSQTLLKPLAWQGDLALGAVRDGEQTFEGLEGHPGWHGLPDLEQAGHRAILGYLSAYGPATMDRLRYWLGEGLSAGKHIARWVAGLGDQITELDIEGETALHLTEHLDELDATPPSSALVLLPGYDQWVLGPGTADQHVVPPELRQLATRGANLALLGGRVAGTWKAGKDELVVEWKVATPPPRDQLDECVARVAPQLKGRFA